MKAYMQMLTHSSPYASHPDISCLEPKSLGKSAHFAKKVFLPLLGLHSKYMTLMAIPCSR
jgi:hypothetical protein